MSRCSNASLRRFRKPATIENLEKRILLAGISGHVFFDLNGNGVQDAGEKGVANGSQLIFLDQNDNGIIDPGEQSTSVGSFGDYSFKNLAAGTYLVRLEQDAGYLRTTPAVDSMRVTVTALQNAAGPVFGLTRQGMISGFIYNDANHNSAQNSGEPLLPNSVAFLDQNNNGTLDSKTSNFSSSNLLLPVSGLSGLITDVNVTANISSPDANGLQLYLEDPHGIREQLERSVNTSLSQFNLTSGNGTWRLIVQDTSTSNPAKLNSWSLQITSGDPQFQTAGMGGYFFQTWPGSYTVRTEHPGFVVTQPSAANGQKYSVKVGANNISPDKNFGMREVGTTKQTVTLATAANIAHLTQKSPFAIVQGDFNKDGKIDLATVNNGSNNVGIYLGKGNGTFNNPVFYPVGHSPRGIAMADLNNDGSLDLVVTNHDDHNISVLLGNGNGTFKTQATYPVGTNLWSDALADFNGDGKLDVLVGNNNANHVSILLGNGNGAFNTSSPIEVPAGFYPMAVKVVDMNNDGKMDIVAANSNDNNISVALGNGNGTFKAAINTPVGKDPVALNVVDLNGDGKKDIITANAGENDITVLLGKGNGSFYPGVKYAAGNTPAAVNLGDVNNDGKTDVIISNRSTGTGGTGISGDVRVYLSNGDGTLQLPFIFTAHTSPVFTATGDFNGDGKLDLAVANFLSNDVSVLTNTTMAFTTQSTFSFSGNVFNDVNGNGIKDPGDNGIPDITVYVDSNDDKIFQSTEPHAITDASGNYSISGLAPSNPSGNPPYYVVRQITPTGDTQTSPTQGLGEHVTITNFNVIGVNFGTKRSV